MTTYSKDAFLKAYEELKRYQKKQKFMYLDENGNETKRGSSKKWTMAFIAMNGQVDVLIQKWIDKSISIDVCSLITLFLIHPCENCQDSGYIPCQFCGDSGQTNRCNLCDGQGKVTCHCPKILAKMRTN